MQINNVSKKQLLALCLTLTLTLIMYTVVIKHFLIPLGVYIRANTTVNNFTVLCIC